jgi:hypothetical protein
MISASQVKLFTWGKAPPWSGDFCLSIENIHLGESCHCAAFRGSPPLCLVAIGQDCLTVYFQTEKMDNAVPSSNKTHELDAGSSDLGWGASCPADRKSVGLACNSIVQGCVYGVLVR